MPPNPADVDKILQTILVPSFPTNRSQWRKLDLALKFINKSKHSATQTRKKSNAQEYNSKPIIYCKYPEKCKDTIESRLKVRMDINPIDGEHNWKGRQEKGNSCLKKRGSWSKKNVLLNISCKETISGDLIFVISYFVSMFQNDYILL